MDSIDIDPQPIFGMGSDNYLTFELNFGKLAYAHCIKGEHSFLSQTPINSLGKEEG